jgi:hypothetical protein
VRIGRFDIPRLYKYIDQISTKFAARTRRRLPPERAVSLNRTLCLSLNRKDAMTSPKLLCTCAERRPTSSEDTRSLPKITSALDGETLNLCKVRVCVCLRFVSVDCFPTSSRSLFLFRFVLSVCVCQLLDGSSTSRFFGAGLTFLIRMFLQDLTQARH